MQAMIMAVVTDALKSLDIVDDVQALKSDLTSPRGGFTDVGLHTGLHTIVEIYTHCSNYLHLHIVM